MRPNKYQQGIAALRKPALVVLGGNDMAGGVTAETASTVFKEYSDAEVVIIKNEWHHVQNSPEAVAEVAAWMNRLLERN